MAHVSTKATAAQSAVSPKPRNKQDSSLHTPSWTDIVSAYHAEGNGDREMLLALLNAKAKEDERLAALDLLRAEQLRAYTAHLAVHGPLYPAQYQHQHQPYPVHHPHLYAQQPQRQQPHASSSSSSASSSIKTRKRNPTSRSPSLSNSSDTRLSSPELVKTPDDERRLSGLSISDRDALVLPPPNSLKRKSPEYTAEERAASNSAKRVSPPRQQVPSIADLLPASQAVERHQLNRNVTASQQEAQLGESQKRATSPRSLQHILNQELRPLMSLGSYRAQTSDVRSSSSDEDELAEA